MKNWKRFQFVLLLFAVPVWSQTSKTARGQTGLSIDRTSICSSGGQFNATDTNVIYICGPTNQWAVIRRATSPQGPPGIRSPNSDITVGTSSIIKGFDPWADVTRFGARAVTSVPKTVANCNRTTRITVSSTNGFQNGDGITIWGCGATNAMSTPGALTATPSLAAGETGSEWVVNSPAGNSTYKYCIIASKQNWLSVI